MKYHFTVAAVFSKASGGTWIEATLPTPGSWDGVTDPVLAFNHVGYAFLVVEPLRFDPDDITTDSKASGGGLLGVDPAILSYVAMVVINTKRGTTGEAAKSCLGSSFLHVHQEFDPHGFPPPDAARMA